MIISYKCYVFSFRVMGNFDYTSVQRRGRGRRSERRSRNPWTEGGGGMEEDPEGYGAAQPIQSPASSYASMFRPKKRKREKVVIDNSQYDSLPMCGIEVRLPVGLKPYPSQKLMMVRLITSLTKRLNFLAESPTGSGKTLALLASSCAWLDDYKKKRLEARIACPVHNSRRDTSYASIKQELEDDVQLDQNVKSELNEVKPEPLSVKSGQSYDDEFFSDFAHTPRAQQYGRIDLPEEPVEPKIEKNCICLPKTRIYYGTRTHKQIGQVVKEFARLPYAGVLKCVGWIPPYIVESYLLYMVCGEVFIEFQLGCRFKDAMKPAYEKPSNLRIVLEQMDAVVFDIEELVESLSSMAKPICPYFSSTRVLTQDADIIFCPFSYLVDPIIRHSSDVHLRNSVVILDEAHNIEDNCREAASFTFHEKEVADALANIREKENLTLMLIEKVATGADLMEGVEKEAVNMTVDNHGKYLEHITKLALLVDDLLKWFRDSASKLLENAYSDSMGNLSQTVNHAYLDVDLKRFRLHPDNARYEHVQAAFNAVCSAYQEGQENRQPEMKLSSIAIVCVEKWLYFIGYFKDEEKRSMYKMNVSSEYIDKSNDRSSFAHGNARRSTQGGPKNVNYSQTDGDVWLSSSQGPSGHVPIRQGYKTSISLWCMSPELAFTSAFSDCRSVVLASGTLCPVETLKTELGLKFHSQMEGDQVIPADQIFASVLPVGLNGHRMCATYQNVANVNSRFISELALIVSRICMSVPKGILCFFPSYRVLNLLFEHMEVTSMLRQIQTRKVVVKEPRRSSDMHEVMEVYEDAVKSPEKYGRHVDGALMFAVFRGKVSEGIDFVDDLARVVISVGIPFPNAMDDLVKEKKAYNNEYCKIKSLLTGDQWYVSQAYRALNQALGRCLRHRNDWGALVLIDERLVEQAKPQQNTGYYGLISSAIKMDQETTSRLSGIHRFR
ncbi:DNA repair helicase [Cooperia oncophora]